MYAARNKEGTLKISEYDFIYDTELDLFYVDTDGLEDEMTISSSYLPTITFENSPAEIELLPVINTRVVQEVMDELSKMRRNGVEPIYSDFRDIPIIDESKNSYKKF